MKYEWDEEKYHLNFHKHRVRFEEAVIVISDPNANEFTEFYSNEERYIFIGLNPVIGLLVVVYCERERDVYRIISARKATRSEEVTYEERI